jgi:glutathione synthase/RimK-type ligase-like ATP-grasp enzyme
MPILVVVQTPAHWPLEIPDVQVVQARAYLTEPAYSELRNVKLFNLSRSYRYQSLGYYVSLLAEARGHRPIPDVSTIQEMKSQTTIRFVSDDLDELIQHALAPIASRKFVLSIYFGQSLAKRYRRLSKHLFNLFHSPLLRAHFAHSKSKWILQNIEPIAVSEVPEFHRPFILKVAGEYLAGRRPQVRRRRSPRFDLAILQNPAEAQPPSDERALRRFARAAEALGMQPELIAKDDYARVAEFDALFIRETTAVNHHTYRFSLRAAKEGLVVIDDPESILRCCNKVYLAELLDRYEVRTPRTLIVHRDNVGAIAAQLGLPCILKQPDSAFSQGVVKVDDLESLRQEVQRLLERSDLVIAQEFLPTEFDWRVGVFDRKPLFVCRYYMAPRHWQIVRNGGSGKDEFGRVEALPVEEAPPGLVSRAVQAANLIGDGLYGVDLKQSGKRFYVMEVNDNPNVDAGMEDAVLKDQLYLTIMSGFLRRIELLKARH